MKKVRIFLGDGIALLDGGQPNVAEIVKTENYKTIIANVLEIRKDKYCYHIQTDCKIKRTRRCYDFLADFEHFDKIRWVE